ncbi:MAG: transglutaminase family protein [Limisphaerales bacterium]
MIGAPKRWEAIRWAAWLGWLALVVDPTQAAGRQEATPSQGREREAARAGGRLEGGGDLEAILKAAAERTEAGDFSGAERLLGEALENRQGRGPTEGRARLEFAKDRLRRIRRDFPLTRGEVIERLKTSVKDFAEPEFDRWEKEGLWDWRMIDGEARYFVSSVSNLFFRRPDLRARRIPARDTAVLQRAHWENARAIREAARREATPYVLPKKFRVRMEVRVLPGSVEPGAAISAWMPVPRQFPHQTGFELLGTRPGTGLLAPADSPIRSVHLKGVGLADGSAEFEVEYAYLARGVSFDLSRSAAGAAAATGGASVSEVGRYLTPGPHVEFTDDMKRLADGLGAGLRDPVERARRFYEWISGNIRYSYAPEYSTIPNLGEACRASGRGDCGQAAFLLMTLCRISGIPARWQSGWAIFPGDETIHDWCELHFAPWGWVPVDPYMGMYAMQYATALTPAQREELRDFYFGGLTQYRMAANSDHERELWPPKDSIRSDPVDFQRGEVEAGGRNLYFDRFRYDLKWEEINKP